jgi:hypothetical protein
MDQTLSEAPGTPSTPDQPEDLTATLHYLGTRFELISINRFAHVPATTIMFRVFGYDGTQRVFAHPIASANINTVQFRRVTRGGRPIGHLTMYSVAQVERLQERYAETTDGNESGGESA